MDNRSYPRDRPLIHNPNHQTAPPPPQHPPYSSYSSSGSSQAPPVHVPFGDPYVQRDPFLPASQHQRRGSYGIHSGPGPAGSPPTGAVSNVQPDRPPLGGSGWGNTGSQHSLSHAHHSQQSSLPPPPPPQLSTALPPASGPPFSSATEPGRRGSLGSGSPPTYYQTTRDPLPPPPSIGNRQMLPPSPQQQNASNNLSNQRPFSGSRELPGLGSSHRQGSGMSISSLLGNAPSTAPSQNSPPTVSSASPPSKSMQPPSPRRTLSGGSRNDYSIYRRPQTPPDKFQVNPTARTSDPHSYISASPVKHGSVPTDHDQRRQPGSQNTSPWRGIGAQESKFYSPTNVGREKEGHSASSGPLPPRPNSQPQPGPDVDRKPPFSSDYRRPPYAYSPEERHRNYPDHAPPRSVVPEASERPIHAGTDQGRAVTAQPSTHSQFSPPRESSMSGQQHGQHPQAQPQSLFWRHQVGDESRRQSGTQSREDSTIGRSPYSASSTSAPSGRSSASLGADSAPLPPRTLEYSNPRSVGHYQPPPTSDPSSTERRRDNITSVPNQTGRASPYDGHAQRSFLGLGPDANRRTGRASPLPQAVQGASLQPVGPAGNPNIKSEFGRMFSGLGGGISSVPSRTGASTPSRQSPLPHGPGDSHPGSGGHLQELEMVRSVSQSGRRAKRTKDEDGIADSDSVDGRVTPSLAAARGQKRSKHAHPASHHHHHHTHQYGALSQSQGESRANMAASHHHHHHKPDEEPPAPAVGAFGGPRFNGTSAPSAPGLQAVHHHHHHHAAHPPHHHHHAPRPGTGPPAPIPAPPKVVVNIQSVLDGVAHLPRNHLGSQLYEAQAVLPPSTVPLDDKFMTNTYPKPLPSFTHDRANCTFTVRIPRYYLKTRQRELLCKRPYIWGARIYRDDSDPLAAAIHSGWVRGAWDKDEVDVAMLDPRLQPSASTDAANSTNNSTNNATGTSTASAAAAPSLPELDELVSSLPSYPVDPPADCDLHLTLLLLPPLDKYHSTVEYGVRSRKAGGGYHGMSYMILSMRWVDEGMGSRGQERGAEARSKRLSAAAALLKLMMGGIEGGAGGAEVEGGVKGIGGQAVVRKAVIGAS